MTDKYYKFEEANGNKFLLKCNPEAIPAFDGRIYGAPTVLAARLLGLSFPQYLRYCRDVIGAEVIGRKKLYPVIYFEKNPAAMQLVKLLNSRMEILMKLYENPYLYTTDDDENIIKTDLEGNIIDTVDSKLPPLNINIERTTENDR